MKECPMCSNDIEYNDSYTYCPTHGVLLTVIGQEKDYAEMYVDRGMWTVSMKITKEFNSVEDVEEECYHTCFGEGENFDSYTITEGEKTSTEEKYPYICVDCERIVSDTDDKICVDCGGENWRKR